MIFATTGLFSSCIHFTQALNKERKTNQKRKLAVKKGNKQKAAGWVLPLAQKAQGLWTTVKLTKSQVFNAYFKVEFSCLCLLKLERPQMYNL